MDRLQLREELIAEALRRGFVAAGIAGVRPFLRARERGLRALAEGRMEGMPWYDERRVVGITDPAGPHPWARSLLALAWPCPPALTPGDAPPQHDAEPGRPRGRMSSYACLPSEDAGAESAVDYHDHLTAACDDLAGWLRERVPEAQVKRFVDHGWAMDRAVAERAGIGFAGKHAGTITTGAGSYVLLAEMLLSVSLPPSAPSRRSCGRCSACLPACPTGAIVAPGVIDAPRCISYLTIEHRGAIPVPLRPLMGTWVFGCDLCQEACPINHRLAPRPLPAAAASTQRGPVAFPDLVECLQLDEDEFRRRFRHTAVWRTGRAGLARNAAIALGNAGDGAALPALRRASGEDPDPVVREAASWAIARLDSGVPATTM
ncbi:MAG TPA: tRNA epoxyqueuosine(34) reductase QueG [Candidatus Dormibacteraeota bacterium]|nr:tRNA epoxyqueuosine(34) reductase QueG [Candidatus Dormibacteraeota bacterium]